MREMERKGEVETITDVNRETRNRHNVRTETENSDAQRHQTPPHTGSDSVKIRSSRAAAVCLVLLCVLLLTAVIVLGVSLHNMIEQFYIKNKNFIDEIQELETNKSNWEKNITKLSNQNKHLIAQKQDLQKMIDTLWQQISKMEGWKCYRSSLYYVSSNNKNWTESKRDCTERGADLIIINNREEQDFVKRVSGDSEVWIGLTEVEGTWKWVDDSALTPGFWEFGKPSASSGNKDCAVNLSSGFADYSCDTTIKWICEKNNLKN